MSAGFVWVRLWRKLRLAFLYNLIRFTVICLELSLTINPC
jgi:hypothetical protein